jgi:hypothetical protein
LVAIAIAAAPNLLSAQTHQPYAGLEARPIKALSDEQIADLHAGRGMGMALPAELNGCPGPVHVLELAESIQLSDVQRTKVQELFDAMQAEAVPLGEKLISQEANWTGYSRAGRSPRQVSRRRPGPSARRKRS